MKRLQIMIEEEQDAELERLSREQHVSKAELIRRVLREKIRPLPPIEEDPLMIWAREGGEGWEPEHHDDIIYPR